MANEASIDPSGVSLPVGISRGVNVSWATTVPFSSRIVHSGMTATRSLGPKCAISASAVKVSSLVNVRFFKRNSGTVGPQ